MLPRHVIFVDPPAFCTTLEELVAPALRARPIVVAAPGADRATVLALSPEARLAGITRGMPVAKARKLQAMVKDFYAMGSLAVRVDVTFESGNSLDGEQVTGSMRNLVQVVRDELGDNKAWLELFDETLQKISGENC